MVDLTEEDVFADDKDPLEAIRQIRRDEGVAEDDLPGNDEERLAGHAAGDLPDDELEDDSDLEEIRGSDESDEEEPAADDKSADEEPADDTEDETPTDDGQEEEADTEESKADSKVGDTLKFRANGQDFTFTEDEIKEQFETVFGQAMDYTKKMQKMAPYRKMISAIEEQNLTQDQLNLAIDALKGDKGAIAQILEVNKIDSFDLTNDEDQPSPYVPGNYGKDEKQLEIEEITGKISADEEYKITVDVIDEQWDQSSRQAIAESPKLIMGLHNDIKNGVYDKVAPIAMKMKVIDGNSKSDIEYYMLAGQRLHQAMAAQQEAGSTITDLNSEAQDAESKFEAESSEAKRKRSARSTGARSDRKGVVDYLDDNDEDFDAWYKKIHANA